MITASGWWQKPPGDFWNCLTLKDWFIPKILNFQEDFYCHIENLFRYLKSFEIREEWIEYSLAQQKKRNTETTMYVTEESS